MNEIKQQKEDLKRLRNRINWFCEHKINAFSPTISPAPKSVQRNEIESIQEAVRYYADRGVKEFVVQKKYMGSYCDIYLHRNIEETYFVSRNGYRIQHMDLDAAKIACRELHERFDWNGLNLVIIQTELMPWSILGKGLIDNEFEGYLNAHQNHLSFLQGSGLYGKIRQLQTGKEFGAFVQDQENLNAKELKQKYPMHIIRQYTAMEQFKQIDLKQYQNGIRIYEEQVSHFGKEGPVCFKPFNILKKVFDDGTEELVDDNCSYALVNDDEMLFLKIDDVQNMEAQIQKVYTWFETLTSEQEEGIVIKPRKAFEKGLAPAFKVRNNHYLTMIYGVDFIQDLTHHIKSRSIGRKVACSVNDWMLNYNLLAIPYNELHKENYYLKNLVYDRIKGEKAQATLDTRL